MLLAAVFGWALFILGLLLSFQGVWLMCRALWPQRVQETTIRCRRNGVGSFFLGLPIALITVSVSIGLMKLGTPGAMLGFGLLSVFFIYANVGVTGLATHIGQRLTSPVDEDRPWRATIRGGIVLSLAWLPPIIGWVAILPISLIIGTGAMTLSFFRRATVAPSIPGYNGGPETVQYAAPVSAVSEMAVTR